MAREIKLGNSLVGLDRPTYFIADIAANHDGSLERAIDLIYQCADAGANAAKFQNFKASSIVSDHGFKNLGDQLSHQKTWSKSVFEVYQDASLPPEWSEELRKSCANAGIDYLTAPYDIGFVKELSKYVCAWKLGSGDITWHESISAMASDGKPLLIATGASDMEDVRMAMNIATEHTDDIVLMQCNTNYTASLENFRYVSLNVLKAYEREFPNVILGLSDHTPGHVTVLGAVALGARVIEKHFTDDTSRDGPDHKFSMDSGSWREMVVATRYLEAALGEEEKKVMDNEAETVVIQRRSLRTSRPLTKGQVINAEDLVALRPCPNGSLPPYRRNELVGRTVNRDLLEGECVKLCDIEK